MNEHKNTGKTIVSNWFKSQRIGTLRLLTGLIQGLLLLWLWYAMGRQSGVASYIKIFMPLLFLFLFVPPVIISSLSSMRMRLMVLWSLAVAVVALIVGFYQGWRLDTYDAPALKASWFLISNTSWAIASFAFALFIGDTLVRASEHDRQQIAAYDTYYDISWGMFTQIVFCVLFSAGAWVVYTLAGDLFGLVGWHRVAGWLNSDGFSVIMVPITTAFAFHLTDLRPGVVREIHSMLQLLLSWLLIPATLLAALFLIFVMISGFTPLWHNRQSSLTIILMSVVLIILTNASFRNGHAGYRVSRPIRIMTRVTVFVSLILCMLGFIGLIMRTGQYGWTSDRITAALVLVICTGYSLGYVWSAIDTRHWMQKVMPVNLCMAYALVAVLLLGLLPILDPALLTARTQVTRALEKHISPEQIDARLYVYDPSIFGRTALTQLTKIATENSDFQSQIATLTAIRNNYGRSMQNAPRMGLRNYSDGSRVIDLISGWLSPGRTVLNHRELAAQQSNFVMTIPSLSGRDLAGKIILPIEGQTLPDNFLAEKITVENVPENEIPDCLSNTRETCQAYILNIAGMPAGTTPDVLLVDPDKSVLLWLEKRGDLWHSVAMHTDLSSCPEFAVAMRKGNYTARTTTVKTLRVGGALMTTDPDGLALDCSAIGYPVVLEKKVEPEPVAAPLSYPGATLKDGVDKPKQTEPANTAGSASDSVKESSTSTTSIKIVNGKRIKSTTTVKTIEGTHTEAPHSMLKEQDDKPPHKVAEAAAPLIIASTFATGAINYPAVVEAPTPEPATARSTPPAIAISAKETVRTAPPAIPTKIATTVAKSKAVAVAAPAPRTVRSSKSTSSTVITEEELPSDATEAASSITPPGVAISAKETAKTAPPASPTNIATTVAKTQAGAVAATASRAVKSSKSTSSTVITEEELLGDATEATIKPDTTKARVTTGATIATDRNNTEKLAGTATQKTISGSSDSTVAIPLNTTLPGTQSSITSSSRSITSVTDEVLPDDNPPNVYDPVPVYLDDQEVEPKLSGKSVHSESSTTTEILDDDVTTSTTPGTTFNFTREQPASDVDTAAPASNSKPVSSRNIDSTPPAVQTVASAQTATQQASVSRKTSSQSVEIVSKTAVENRAPPVPLPLCTDTRTVVANNDKKMSPARYPTKRHTAVAVKQRKTKKPVRKPARRYTELTAKMCR